MWANPLNGRGNEQMTQIECLAAQCLPQTLCSFKSIWVSTYFSWHPLPYHSPAALQGSPPEPLSFGPVIDRVTDFLLCFVTTGRLNRVLNGETIINHQLFTMALSLFVGVKCHYTVQFIVVIASFCQKMAEFTLILCKFYRLFQSISE